MHLTDVHTRCSIIVIGMREYPEPTTYDKIVNTEK